MRFMIYRTASDLVGSSAKALLRVLFLAVLAALGASFCTELPAHAQSGSALTEAKQHYQNAVTAIGTGDWQKAKNELLKTEQLAPRNALVHYDLALAFSHLGEVKSAQDELNRAVTLGLPAGQQQAAADLRQQLEASRFNQLLGVQQQGADLKQELATQAASLTVNASTSHWGTSESDRLTQQAEQFRTGKGVTKDEAKARQLFETAAKVNNLEAETRLGEMMIDGRGGPQDWKNALEWITKAAQAGYAPAESDLGLMYHQPVATSYDASQSYAWCKKAADAGEGRGEWCLGLLASDPSTALSWFRKSDEHHYPGGTEYVAHRLLNGIGTPKDVAEAIGQYRKTAALADTPTALEWQGIASSGSDAFDALYSLGRLYSVGVDVSADSKLAQSFYTRAYQLVQPRAVEGYASAEAVLGILYEAGYGVPQSREQAAIWIKRAANQGYAQSEEMLGFRFQNGSGVPKNYTNAMFWYRKAADQGFPVAETSIGYLYLEGYGVAQDYGQAMIWYRKAADQGLPQAETSIGYLYLEGYGVAQDYGQAMIWYRKAADQGLPQAETSIGYLYLEGYGVARDYGQAMIWYRKAADQGLPEAETSIGDLCAMGYGVPPDYVPPDYGQAMIWYRKAADQGLAAAEYRVGILYATGHGVPQDSAQARVWYQKAVAQGDQAAQKALASLDQSQSSQASASPSGAIDSNANIPGGSESTDLRSADGCIGRVNVPEGDEIIAAVKNLCSEPVVVAWCYKPPNNNYWTSNLQHTQMSGGSELEPGRTNENEASELKAVCPSEGCGVTQMTWHAVYASSGQQAPRPIGCYNAPQTTGR
jgi:TPR repeat protein